MREPPNARGAEALAWALALAAGACALAASGYRSYDGDSGLYAFIVARISVWPVQRWIAPEWTESLFREHPAGLFWPAAALARLGFPAVQAAYAMNGLYQAASLVLAQRLAAGFTGGLESRAVAWSLQVMPLAFALRVRANHEAAVLACLLAALLATDRSRRSLGWCALTGAALVGLMLVKGVFVLPALASCVLWALVRRGEDDGDDARRRALLGVALASAAVALAAGAYEHAYRAATGQPFLSYYLGKQLGLAAVQADDPWLWLPHKLGNLLWYMVRLLLLALPWSLFSAAGVWRWLRGRLPAPRNQAHLLAAGITALYVLSMSLSDRRADRYIFPAYFAVAAWGSVAAVAHSPQARRLAAALDRWHPFAAPALWLALLLVHVGIGSLGLGRLRL